MRTSADRIFARSASGWGTALRVGVRVPRVDVGTVRAVADPAELHRAVAVRLARTDQRYTAPRRALVDLLSAADRPLSVAELLGQDRQLAQSSIYRNLEALADAGIAQRVIGTDDTWRWELAESWTGDHHHHVVCENCGLVVDVPSDARLERALTDAARSASGVAGFSIREHRLDLLGLCARCSIGPPAA
jgi:Fur family transcriptional regulator, ferric uptake regulator